MTLIPAKTGRTSSESPQTPDLEPVLAAVRVRAEAEAALAAAREVTGAAARIFNEASAAELRARRAFEDGIAACAGLTRIFPTVPSTGSGVKAAAR